MTLSPFAKSAAHWLSIDHQIMSLALQLAKKAQYTARPNPMVGCVLVQGEKIVGQGWHQKWGQAHAEVNALKQAGDKAKDATCYVTLEPCAHVGKTGSCAQALIDAGVSRVVVAMEDPNSKVSGKGFQMLNAAGIRVECGLLESQALQLNRGFVSRFTHKRPWVTCKLAMSLDGRTALADGTSQWITGSSARAEVQKLRARQDAIITGIGTVLSDNPSLTVRSPEAAFELDNWFEKANQIGFKQPARVLLDRQGRAEASAKLFNDDADVYWFSDNFKTVDEPELNQKKSHIKRMPSFESLLPLLNFLAEKEVNQVLVEAGHKLAGAFLQQGLIDELIIYMAPKLMGNSGQGLFELNVTKMLDAPQLKLKDIRQLGEDIRLTYRIRD